MARHQQQEATFFDKAQVLIERAVNEGHLKQHERTLSWVGDKALDQFLALVGESHGLAPSDLEGIKQQLFTEKNLGCGIGRLFVEEVEEEVGRLVASPESQKKKLEALDLPMTQIRIRDPAKSSAVSVVKDTVANLVERFCAEKKAGRDFTQPQASSSQNASTEIATLPARRQQECRFGWDCWNVQRHGSCRFYNPPDQMKYFNGN